MTSDARIGHKNLTPEQVSDIQEIRAVGAQLERLIKKHSANPEADQGWVSIADQGLRTGLMHLVRAITKPEFF